MHMNARRLQHHVFKFCVASLQTLCVNAAKRAMLSLKVIGIPPLKKLYARLSFALPIPGRSALFLQSQVVGKPSDKEETASTN